MAHVSQEKAKEILRHGEVRGHDLTKKQRGYFGARAGGATMKAKNAPLFPTSMRSDESDATPQEREPLNGPEGAFVGNPPGTFAGKTGHGFDGTDEFKVSPPHPAPIQDSDFPSQATFTKSTKGAMDTGGLV